MGFTGEVEGLSDEGGIPGQLLRQIHVRRGPIFHVEIVPYVLAVRTDDGGIATQPRADRAGHNPIPVEISAAVEVAAASDPYRQAECCRVRLAYQVSACLADVVGVAG